MSIIRSFLNFVNVAGGGGGGSLGLFVKLAPSSSTDNIIQPTGDFIPLIIRGIAGQTSDLEEWQDSSSNVLASMSASGGFFCQTASFAGVVGGSTVGAGTPYTMKSATVTPPADADYTLTAAELSCQQISVVAGAWTAGHNIIVPTTAGGVWRVSNSSGFALTVKTAAGVGAQISNGFAATVRSNGTDVKYAGVQVNSTTGAMNANGTSSVIALTVSGTLTISAHDIATDTVTGTKIGTATTQKLGFFNAAPVVQQANASQATINAVTDANAKAALQSIYNALKNLGLCAATA
jgi:hypothetical protein